MYMVQITWRNGKDMYCRERGVGSHRLRYYTREPTNIATAAAAAAAAAATAAFLSLVFVL